VEVTVTDRAGLQDVANATVLLNDVDEAPIITTSNGSLCRVQENSVAGTPCVFEIAAGGGIQLHATDQDEMDYPANLTFSVLSGFGDADLGFFSIDSTPAAPGHRHGAIRLTSAGASAVDHENSNLMRFHLFVIATDPVSLESDPVMVDIYVSNSQEGPDVPAGQEFYIDENLPMNTALEGHVIATDPDATDQGNLTFSLGAPRDDTVDWANPGPDLFAINDTSG